jgi:hypothetical protein
MIHDLAENFVELTCLILAVGMAVAMVIGAVRGKRSSE